jgi:hypothetical protein
LASPRLQGHAKDPVLFCRGRLKASPLLQGQDPYWFYSRSCARPPKGGYGTDKWPLVLQPQLRQAPKGADQMYLALCARPPKRADRCPWFYRIKPSVSFSARPPRGQTNGHWIYSRSCARPPKGRTECLWIYGVEPLVRRRARPLRRGKTHASGSTE